MGDTEKRYVSSNPFFKGGGTAAVIYTQTCELCHLSQSGECSCGESMRITQAQPISFQPVDQG